VSRGERADQARKDPNATVDPGRDRDAPAAAHAESGDARRPQPRDRRPYACYSPMCLPVQSLGARTGLRAQMTCIRSRRSYLAGTRRMGQTAPTRTNLPSGTRIHRRRLARQHRPAAWGVSVGIADRTARRILAAGELSHDLLTLGIQVLPTHGPGGTGVPPRRAVPGGWRAAGGDFAHFAPDRAESPCRPGRLCWRARAPDEADEWHIHLPLGSCVAHSSGCGRAGRPGSGVTWAAGVTQLRLCRGLPLP
jgi:hypothetical protein